jgi:hypothetical protein
MTFQEWLFSRRKSEAQKAWTSWMHGAPGTMTTQFHAGFSMGVTAREMAFLAEMPCEHPGGNHSEDRVQVFHGATDAMILCGFHASMIGPKFYEEMARLKEENDG